MDWTNFADRYQTWRNIWPGRSPYDSVLNSEERQLLGKIRRQGYAKVECYLSPEICERLIAAIDMWIVEHAAHVETRGDQRLFGVEVLDGTISNFATDPSLIRIASAFVGSPQKTAFTMANKLIADHTATNAPRASGGDEWHRDKMQLQLKSIIYLKDVTEENGPLCILANSKSPINFVGDFLKNKDVHRVRWSQRDLSKEVVSFERRIHKLTAPAGTVLLFDASAPHRGWPIMSGERYALTNYYRGLTFDPLSPRHRGKFANLITAEGRHDGNASALAQI